MKKQRMKLLAIAGALAAFGLSTGCSSIRERHVTARTYQGRPSTIQVAEGYDTLGRRWGAEAPTPPAVKPVKAVEQKGVEFANLVALRKHAPESVSVGDEFSTELTLTAQEQLADVVVTDHVPAGVEYLRSEPSASRNGDLLTWKFPAMEKGQALTIRNYFKADKEGHVVSCATVAAAPRTCTSTFVGKPVIALVKTGPKFALVGEEITYVNTVSNTGTIPARGVVVTDKIPEGLTHSSGKYELTFDVGDLAPNQSKDIPVTLKAMRRGSVQNNSIASASNAARVMAAAETLIQQPGLAVIKTGDPEQYLNRQAGYKITVRNTGDTTLKNVMVTDTAADATSFVSAEGASIERQSATWMLSELSPGEERTFKAVLTSKIAGSHRNEVAAVAVGLREVAQVSTIWRGLAALLIEVVDDNDPVQIGEETTYTIRVTNQGTADETNIGLTAHFTDLVKPMRAEGLQVNGQTMSVSTIPSLAPKQTVTYTITTRGIRAGDGRLKVTLTADGLATPVIEEESTHVY